MGPAQSRARLFPVGHFLVLVSPYFRPALPHRGMCNHATGSCLFLGAAAEFTSCKAWSYFQHSFGHGAKAKGSPCTASHGGTSLEVPPEKVVTGGSRACLTSLAHSRIKTHLIFAVSHCTKEKNTQCHTPPHLGTIRVCSCGSGLGLVFLVRGYNPALSGKSVVWVVATGQMVSFFLPCWE